jgi:hypothetical protein
MDRMPWTLYLWPGLPQLWKRGRWSALAVAIGCAALVNATLLGTLVWSELFAPGLRTIAWLTVTVIWIGAALFSRLREPASAAREVEPEGDNYSKALEHYLKGNWFEAECELANLLRRNPRDLEAGLLLVALLRHTGRLEEAVRQIQRLERFDGCEKWELELFRERALIEQAQAARSDSSETPPASPQSPSELDSAAMPDAA